MKSSLILRRHLILAAPWATPLAIVSLLMSFGVARAQDVVSGAQPIVLAATLSTASDAIPDAPGYSSSAEPQQSTGTPPPAVQDDSLEGKQTKRILGIVPNFRSVSVNAKLAPMTVKQKFTGATQDSFDYSSFIFAGAIAGVAMAQDSYPEFHQGAAGYARYYWHTFADQTGENYLVEFILPSALHQDPRYYTLGSGGFIKRVAYSFSRIAITRQDGGRENFNYSEVVGAGAASGISSLYYPSHDRDWTKVGQRWATNIGLDGATFVFKEFWPDINNKFFHQKD